MVLRLYLLVIGVIFSFAIGYSQSISTLIGKTIMIPGDNPAEILYTDQVLKKHSFKSKYKYAGNIIGKRLLVDKAYLWKDDYIVVLKSDDKQIVMRFPLTFSSRKYEKSSIFQNKKYYSKLHRTRDFYSSNYTYSTMESLLRIPHYVCSELDSLTQYYVNHAFFHKKTGHGFFLRGVEDDPSGNGYKRVILGSEEEHMSYPIAYRNLKNRRDEDKNLFEMRNLFDNYVMKDTLVAYAKKSEEYRFFSAVTKKIAGRKIHTHEVYLGVASIQNIKNDEYMEKLKGGYYVYQGNKIDAFYHPYHDGLPQFENYVVLQDCEDSTKMYAVPFSVEFFKENVMMADEYDEMIRQRELKAERAKQKRLEEERREEAKAHAALVRKYGARNAKSIEEGRIRLGFTHGMVEESWGYPTDVTTISNAAGRIECWSYGWDSFVYFRNGVVVQIIN